MRAYIRSAKYGSKPRRPEDLSTNGGDRVAVNFAKRIVVKVGTSSLTYDNGKMNLGSIDRSLIL